MKAKEISERLKATAETVCGILLPGGKVQGRYYKAGDVSGGPGESLVVYLSGSKLGQFQDYETGAEKGDLLDLWALSKNINIKTAMIEAGSYLGVPSSNVFKNYVPKKEYKEPPKPKGKRLDYTSEAGMWLMDVKKISQETIKDFRVGVYNNIITTPYIKDSKVMMYKYRDMEKEWADKKNKKHVYSSPDPFKCLMGWHLIPQTARIVVLAEGETDTLSWYEQGVPVLGVPFGAGSGGKQDWIDNEFEDMERFDKIYISMDMDDSGKLAVKEIIERLGIESCWVVDLPLKDANECHTKGLNLKDYLKTAKTIDPAELKNASEFKDEVWKKLNPELIEYNGMMMPWSSTRENIRFRNSELTVWLGMNGHGKSQIIGQVIIAGIAQGERSCIASMEMSASETLKRMYIQVGGDRTKEQFDKITEWLSSGLWIFDKMGTSDNDKLLQVFKYARRRYGIRQFVIDSFTKCMDSEDDYNAQKKFMNQLCDFVIENDCHIHLITHPRKQNDEMSELQKFDIKGTGSISDLAFNVLTVWRNKKKEEEIQDIKEAGGSVPDELYKKADCIMRCLKQRNYDWEGRIKLWFNKNTKIYRDTIEDKRKNHLDFINN